MDYEYWPGSIKKTLAGLHYREGLLYLPSREAKHKQEAKMSHTNNSRSFFKVSYYDRTLKSNYVAMIPAYNINEATEMFVNNYPKCTVKSITRSN
jgi:hypothetical protein